MTSVLQSALVLAIKASGALRASLRKAVTLAEHQQCVLTAFQIPVPMVTALSLPIHAVHTPLWRHRGVLVLPCRLPHAAHGHRWLGPLRSEVSLSPTLGLRASKHIASCAWTSSSSVPLLSWVHHVLNTRGNQKIRMPCGCTLGLQLDLLPTGGDMRSMVILHRICVLSLTRAYHTRIPVCQPMAPSTRDRFHQPSDKASNNMGLAIGALQDVNQKKKKKQKRDIRFRARYYMCQCGA